MAASNIGLKFGNIVLSIISARLLGPDLFGEYVAYLLMLGTIDILSFGMQSALIQKNEVTEHHYNVAWTIEIFGLRIVWIIMFSILMIFFGTEIIGFELSLLALLVINLVFLIKSIEAPVQSQLVREFMWNKRALLDMAKGFTFVVLGLCLLYVYRSPTTILIAALLSQLFRTVVSHYFFKGRLKAAVRVKEFNELFSFGKWLGFQNLLFVIKSHIDKLIVTSYLGLRELADFQVATRLTTQSFSDLIKVSMAVMFPYYSREQDLIQSSHMFFKQLNLFFLSIVPLTLILFFNYEGIIALVFGSEYISNSIGTIVIYSLVISLFRVLSSLLTPVLRARQRTRAEAFGVMIYFLGIAITYMLNDMTEGILSVMTLLLIGELAQLCYYLVVGFNLVVVRLYDYVLIVSMFLLSGCLYFLFDTEISIRYQVIVVSVKVFIGLVLTLAYLWLNRKYLPKVLYRLLLR